MFAVANELEAVACCFGPLRNTMLEPLESVALVAIVTSADVVGSVIPSAVATGAVALATIVTGAVVVFVSAIDVLVLPVMTSVSVWAATVT